MKRKIPVGDSRDFNNAQLTMLTLGQWFTDAQKLLSLCRRSDGQKQERYYTEFKDTLERILILLDTSPRVSTKDIDELLKIIEVTPHHYHSEALGILQKCVLRGIGKLYKKHNIMDFETEKIPLDKVMSIGQR